MILKLNDDVQIAGLFRSRRQIALAAQLQSLARLNTGGHPGRKFGGVLFAAAMADKTDALFRPGRRFFKRDGERVAEIGAALGLKSAAAAGRKNVAEKIAEKILKCLGAGTASRIIAAEAFEAAAKPSG